MAKKQRDTSWPPAPEPLPVPVVDNHTHLEMLESWDADGWDAGLVARPTGPTLADHLARAHSVGVDRVVQVGCDLEAVRWSDNLLREHHELGGVGLLGAIAIHPNEAVLHAGVREIAPDGLDPNPTPTHAISLEDAIAVVGSVARSNSRIRAIGETGLDFFRAGERGREAQREAFRAHIALAKELDLPLQIHDRDAHADVIDILLADGAPERTVFHCFSGDAAMARLCADRGWFLSIAGTVTFRANDAGRAAVAVTPLELLLVETDAPYLTPHPYRGRPNSPYLTPAAVREIARVKDVDLTRVCTTISATSEALYGPW